MEEKKDNNTFDPVLFVAYDLARKIVEGRDLSMYVKGTPEFGIEVSKKVGEILRWTFNPTAYPVPESCIGCKEQSDALIAQEKRYQSLWYRIKRFFNQVR